MERDRAMAENPGFVTPTTTIDMLAQLPEGIFDNLNALVGPAPVVLCTGLLVTPEAITTAGLTGLIAKPFDIEALVAQVRAVSCMPPQAMTSPDQLAS